jgi:DMSO/TMAO reductase YedYZ heme-binding membrane subunit
MKRDERLMGAISQSEDAARATLNLLRRYVLQETLTPLRHLVKRAALGLAAAVLSSAAGLIALIGLLRVLQTETGGAMSGSWSFAPYLLTCVVAFVLIGVVAFLAYRATAKKRRGG